MGIPHLTANLKPYASSVTFPPPNPETRPNEARVVIDGPALAHHIYQERLKDRAKATSLAKTFPSYREIGDAVIEWLFRLRTYGIIIEMIFFDGHLPEYKQPERWQRLQRATTQVVNHRNSHQLGPWLVNGARFPDETDLAKLGKVTSRLRLLPPPAFLAPSVLEALRSSKFGFCTSVVPGEADVYCADYVRENGGVILTNDSDLLVHDLGLSGSVIFLNDIAFPSKQDAPLKSLQFRPKEIAERLRLRSIIQLAWSMKESQWFHESVQLAKNISVDSPTYNSFAKQFSVLPPRPELADGAQQGDLPFLTNMLRWLDTRVSEYVYNGASGLLAPTSNGTSQDEPLTQGVMYLPILVEDATRATAWACGAEIRRIGYSLLNINCSNKHAEEVRRRNFEIIKIQVELQNPQVLMRDCKNLLRDLEQHFQRHVSHRSEDTAQIWQVYGAKAVCEVLLDSGKSIPEAGVMIRLLEFEHSIMDSWAFIHLEAQLQAALYSLRMLKQFIDVFIAAVSTGLEHLELIQVTKGLQERLTTLPSLKDIFEPSTNRVGIHKDDTKTAVETLYSSLGVKEDAKDLPLSKAEKKKIKKARKDHAPAKQQFAVKGTTAANVFAVLETNDPTG
ncbi:MAG: hypothetical protein M1822_006289 [Bathelium mastoideum]|nr:MAG: hypothetical protein M1822_006289 [Bathelium mastoideum]